MPTFDMSQYANAVVDLSHWNEIPDMGTVKADGIFGIVHKATQGTRYVDQLYSIRRESALNAGIAWGAYHFGDGEDGAAQAELFLKTVQPDAKTLIALDLESNPSGPSMKLAGAEAFVQTVYDQVGRWPVLYTGAWYLREIMPRSYAGLLTNCPLWIASYTAEPIMPPQWAAWTFWQFTNGIEGNNPHASEHMRGCDREVFNGGLAALTEFWGVGAQNQT